MYKYIANIVLLCTWLHSHGQVNVPGIAMLQLQGNVDGSSITSPTNPFPSISNPNPANFGFTYANVVTNITTLDIASDFGPRTIPSYGTYWHKGLDMGTQFQDADAGDLIRAIRAGTVSQLVVESNQVYITIQDNNSANFCYYHLFANNKVTDARANGAIYGNAILKSVIGNNNRFAIIIFTPGNTMPLALSTSSNDSVSYNGITYQCTNQVVAGDYIAPMGDSRASNVHLHLYSLRDPNGNLGDEDNVKNPLQYLINTQPAIEADYSIGVDSIHYNTASNNNYNMLNIKVLAKVTHNSYRDSTIGCIEKIDLKIKRKDAPPSTYKSIQGRHGLLRNQYGGLNGQTNLYYPYSQQNGGYSIRTNVQPRGNPVSFGDMDRSGILAAEEYQSNTTSQLVKTYHFNDFPLRIHKSSGLDNVNFSSALINEDARYGDGMYTLKATLLTILGDSLNHVDYDQTRRAERDYLIDNFKPYIESAEISDFVFSNYLPTNLKYIERFGKDALGGNLIYKNGRDAVKGIVYGETPLKIKVETSEPMQQLVISGIRALPYNGTPAATLPGTVVNSLNLSPNQIQGDTIFYFLINPALLQLANSKFEKGVYVLKITGSDLSGNNLIGFDRNLSNTIMPPIQWPGTIGVPIGNMPYRISKTGATQWHNQNFMLNDFIDESHFFIVDPICSSNRTSTACLDAEFTSSTNSVAVNDPVVFTNTTTAGTPPYSSYYWDFGDGNSSTFQNPVHLYHSAGVYHVSFTVTDATGNIDTEYKQAEVTVGNPGTQTALTADFYSNDLVVAPDQPIQLINTTTGGEPQYQYSWFVPDAVYLNNTTSYDKNPVVKFTTNGYKNFQLSVVDNNGVVKQKINNDYIYVTADSLVADFDYSNSDGQVTFWDRSRGVQGFLQYTWKFGDGLGDSTNTPHPTHIYTATPTENCIIESNNVVSSSHPPGPGSGAFEVELLIKDSYTGRTALKKKKICVWKLDANALDYVAYGPMCENKQSSFAYIYNGTLPQFCQIWYILKKQLVSNSTYTTISTFLGGYAPPGEVGIGGISIINGQYNGNDGSLFQYTFNPYIYSNNITYPGYGNYEMEIYIVNTTPNSGGQGTTNISMTKRFTIGKSEINLADISISNDCITNSTPAILTPVVNTACSDFMPSLTNWTLKNATGNIISQSTGASLTLPVPAVFPATYKVIAIVYNNHGNASIKEKVFTLYRNPDFNIPQATTICPGSLLDLSTIMQYSFGVNEGVDYNWNSFNYNQLFSNTSIRNPTFSTTQPGYYYCSLTTTDSINHCTVSKPFTLIVQNMEAGFSNGNNIVVCSTNPPDIIASVTGGNTPYTYDWSDFNGVNCGSCSTYTAALNPGVYTYNLYVSDQLGCTDTATITIDARKTIPQVFAGPDLTICDGSGISITASGSGCTGAPEYKWAPLSSGNFSIAGQTLVENNPHSSYTVQLTDSWSKCTATDQVIINKFPVPVTTSGVEGFKLTGYGFAETVCQGQVLVFNAADYISNANGYQLKWKDIYGNILSNNGIVQVSPTSDEQVLVLEASTQYCTYQYKGTVWAYGDHSRTSVKLRFIIHPAYNSNNQPSYSDLGYSDGLHYLYGLQNCLQNANTDKYYFRILSDDRYPEVLFDINANNSLWSQYQFRLYKISLDGSAYTDLSAEISNINPYTGNAALNAVYWEIDRSEFDQEIAYNQYFIEISKKDQCNIQYTNTYLVCDNFVGVPVFNANSSGYYPDYSSNPNANTWEQQTYGINAPMCRYKSILPYNFAPYYPPVSVICNTSICNTGNNPMYNSYTASHQAGVFAGRKLETQGSFSISNRSVDFIANESIRLLPGFKVLQGGKFRAFIDDICYQEPPVSNSSTGGGNDNGGNTQGSGISSKSSLEKIFIYPNPATSMLNIKIGDNGMYHQRKIIIIDAAGNRITEIAGLSSNLSIDISRLSNGMYYLLYYHNNVLTGREKFIVAK